MNIHTLFKKITLFRILSICFITYFIVCSVIMADSQIPSALDNDSAEFSAIDKIDIQSIEEKTRATEIKYQTNTQEKKDELILFKPKNENKLEIIINRLAELSGRNIILPQEASFKDITVNFDYPEKISIEDAWEKFLPTVLDIAGYSICPKGDLYAIIKNEKEISKEPMPIYINTTNSDKNIPDTDQRIRYLHYFTNIKILTIKDVLQGLVAGLFPSDTIFEMDPSTNSFILCAKANNIKAFLKIIEPLDIPGFQEEYDIIELKYADAKTVAAIFNDQILKSEQDRNRYRLDAKKESKETYFSSTVKIIPAERLRSLILLGKPQAIQRIKDVIKKYIDVPVDKAESIIHTYQLQYLDAYDLKPILEQVIQSKRGGGTGQSQGQNSEMGPERWFQDVIIYADSVKEKDHSLKYPGTNTLIVAAQADDWKQIKELIKKLDSPQPQVLIEILIADLTLNDARNLGAITRNPDNFSLPGSINFQSAHFNGIITDSPVSTGGTPTTIKADLLGDTAVGSKPGQTLVSLNDSNGATWSLLQIINSFTDSKVLSHPHIITTNNQSALVSSGENRLLPDEASGATGGTATQVFRTVKADLEINIKPRISSDNLINLQIDINVDHFAIDNPVSGTKITRKLVTNANVPNKTILPLGGIIQKGNRVSQNETPLLARIPLIGWLFKNRSGDVAESHVTIFILPTIIQPRLRPGISKYTSDYIHLSQQYADEGNLFDRLKEPITHLFFKTDHDIEQEINTFLSKDEFKTDFYSHHNGPDDNPEQSFTEIDKEKKQTKLEKKRKKTNKNKKIRIRTTGTDDTDSEHTNNTEQDSSETDSEAGVNAATTDTDTHTKHIKQAKKSPTQIRTRKRKINTSDNPEENSTDPFIDTEQMNPEESQRRTQEINTAREINTEGPSLKEILKDSENPFTRNKQQQTLKT